MGVSTIIIHIVNYDAYEVFLADNIHNAKKTIEQCDAILSLESIEFCTNICKVNGINIKKEQFVSPYQYLNSAQLKQVQNNIKETRLENAINWQLGLYGTVINNLMFRLFKFKLLLSQENTLSNVTTTEKKDNVKVH